MENISKFREDTYGFLAAIYSRELTAEHIGNMLKTGVFDLLVESGCRIDIDSIKNRPL